MSHSLNLRHSCYWMMQIPGHVHDTNRFSVSVPTIRSSPHHGKLTAGGTLVMTVLVSGVERILDRRIGVAS